MTSYTGPSCIVPGFLFLGDYKDAVCAGGSAFDELNIPVCRVLNVCGGRYPDSKYLEHLRKRAPSVLDDDDVFAICPVCDYGTAILDQDKKVKKALRFLEDARAKQHSVLVHCRLGINRSVTVVLLFLMVHENLFFDEAFSLVKGARSMAHPHENYVKQLREWDSKVFRLFRLPKTLVWKIVCFFDSSSKRNFCCTFRGAKSLLLQSLVGSLSTSDCDRIVQLQCAWKRIRRNHLKASLSSNCVLAVKEISLLCGHQIDSIQKQMGIRKQMLEVLRSTERPGRGTVLNETLLCKFFDLGYLHSCMMIIEKTKARVDSFIAGQKCRNEPCRDVSLLPIIASFLHEISLPLKHRLDFYTFHPDLGALFVRVKSSSSVLDKMFTTLIGTVNIQLPLGWYSRIQLIVTEYWKMLPPNHYDRRFGMEYITEVFGKLFSRLSQVAQVCNGELFID